MSGRTNSTNKGKEKETATSSVIHTWGSGQTLGKRTIAQSSKVGAGGAVPRPPQRVRQRSPSPEEEEDWGADDDDDVIMIDSD